MTSIDRRRLLAAAAALPFARGALGADLPLTPACGPQAPLTPRQTEGPYYTLNTPQRASLVEPGFKGARLHSSSSSRPRARTCARADGAESGCAPAAMT
jgi:hypothetical protein